MMFTTLIGAMTLALGPCNATCSTKGISTPRVTEIRAAMFDSTEVDRNRVRFSGQTVGEVVAEVNNGSASWAGSERKKLGGQDAPELIYVQIFDGVFAIDPFQPLPSATHATAQQLFRGTSLETDRTQHGRKYIERTKELFTKLESARVGWLRDNGFYGVRHVTNPNAPAQGEQAKGKTLPEPSAVFERPADVPRGKSREQVKGADRPSMGAVAAMLDMSDAPVRVSLPDHMRTTTVARVERRDTPREDEPVATASDTATQEIAVNR